MDITRVKKIHKISTKKPVKYLKALSLDGITKPVLKTKPDVNSQKALLKKPFVFKDFFTKYKLGLALASMVLIATFGFGFWSAAYTEISQANLESQELLLGQNNIIKEPIPLISAPSDAVNNLNHSEIYSMPLEQLEIVYAKKQEILEIEAEEKRLWQRALKIKNYLSAKKSPWSEAALTIASQSHWRLILAIGFAESSWGRNCVDNNCSNIGVEPGHELWRKYKTYDDWVIDFNKLLERRYKNWTLNEMCGVYVQPCNQNWLSATGQVLEEINEYNIN